MRSIPILGAALASCAVLLFAQTPPATPPSLIYRSEPEYSAEATRARVQSSVTLSVIVGEDGKAHDIHVTQGAGFGLDEKAIEAMDKWRFNPATRDGHPATFPANIEMNFSILARNDKIDRSGQRARLNFTLPPNASRPELIAGQLPGNPAAPGDQSLRFHLEVDAHGVPKDVAPLSATDLLWEKQALAVIKAWRFAPAAVNGAPVAVEGVFELAHSAAEPPALLDNPENITSGADDEDPSAPPHRLSPAPVPIPGFTPRGHHTATLLANGTVLLAGGAAQPATPSAIAQIFDWATHTIVNTGALAEARSNHTATLLRDGTVLVAGGRGQQPLASAEIFDPSTGRFAPTGHLHEAREFQAAAPLPDGRVLVCGGVGPGNKYLASAEIYNPRTRTFTAIAPMTAPRASFDALTLKDGRVLLLGGPGAAGATAGIFDPATAAFRAAGKMSAPRYGFTATLLDTGMVLIAGGSSGSDLGEPLATAELYDPATNSFSPTGSLSTSRVFAAAVLLKNGKVLVSGGLPGSAGASLTATEIYDPAAGTFTAGPALTGRHVGHTATLLQDGTVLVAGGDAAGDGAAAELLTVN